MILWNFRYGIGSIVRLLLGESENLSLTIDNRLIIPNNALGNRKLETGNWKKAPLGSSALKFPVSNFKYLWLVSHRAHRGTEEEGEVQGYRS